jgi:hypothetical protein
MMSAGGSYALEMGPIDVHGFISQGYLQSTANNYLAKSEKGSFEYNEAGINFSTNVSDKLRLGLQLMARDMGDSGNNEVQLDWGFADYRWRNELGLRFGKLKMPMGLYNETRDVDMLRTWILLPQGVYQEYIRDFIVALEGGAIYGTLDAGPAGSFEYSDVLGTIGNMDTSNKSFGAMMVSMMSPYAMVGETVNAEDIRLTGRKFNVASLIWNTPVEGLRLGGTYMMGRVDFEVPEMSQTLYTLIGGIPTLVQLDFPERNAKAILNNPTYSAEYKWKDLTLAAEYMEQKVKMTYDIDTPALLTALGLEMPSGTTTQGYYGSAAYRFTDWLELGAYYSVYYRDKHDKKGEDMVDMATTVANATATSVAVVDHQAWQKDTCVTARFDINPAWCIKLEGHHMNGTAQVFDYSSADDLRKIWTLYAAKATFNF